jgi:predicted negative regulator of RcsB-dependent stress response
MKKIILVLILIIGFLFGYYVREYRYQQSTKEASEYLDSLGY